MLSKKTLSYKAFGLTISSEIPLPELPQLSGVGNVTDIVIEQGDLTTLWAKHSDLRRRLYYKKRLDSVSCRLKRAIFLIQEGT